MRFLKYAFRKEPIGAVALVISVFFLIGQSEYIYDKFRRKLVVSVYHSNFVGESKCRLHQLRMDNRTDDIIEDIRVIVAQDYVTRRQERSGMLISYFSRAALPDKLFKFPDRVALEVPFQFEGNVITVPALNPGEWVDLVMDYSPEAEAEQIRQKFDKSSSEYFTPRIVNISSDDGSAIILHHEDSCLIEAYRPRSDTLRLWESAGD